MYTHVYPVSCEEHATGGVHTKKKHKKKNKKCVIKFIDKPGYLP